MASQPTGREDQAGNRGRVCGTGSDQFRGAGRYRAFAIVPAAGHSRRMATSKLLLPLGGQAVIERVVRQWQAVGVQAVVVVARRTDQPLIGVCRRLGVDLVLPERDPEDMKASVQYGLDHLRQTYRPAAQDVWLLAPADMPGLSPRVVAGLLAAYEPAWSDAPSGAAGAKSTKGMPESAGPALWVPRYGTRRGHPLLVPWSLFDQVHQLPDGVGINALLDTYPVREIPFDPSWRPVDMDTPEDYRRLVQADSAGTGWTLPPGIT